MNTIELHRFGPQDRDWLVDQHRIDYARDEGFDETFGELVAEILDAFLAEHNPTCERGWIAWENGQRLGSVFCVRLDDDTAKLRLFLLTPSARGKGLGKRLLEHCMAFARAADYRQMKLWTHESHEAACALYAKHGWQMESSSPVIAFGKPNIEQHWRIDL